MHGEKEYCEVFVSINMYRIMSVTPFQVQKNDSNFKTFFRIPANSVLLYNIHQIDFQKYVFCETLGISELNILSRCKEYVERPVGL